MEILRELLEIERERLRTAVRIEQERKIVFPETSVIIRDILKLMDAINQRMPSEKMDISGFDIPDLEINF